MDDISNLLKKLTVEEKAALVSGTDFMYTNPIPYLGIPSIRMSDGPHGLRVQNNSGDNGVTGSERATSFPTAATVACSWNPLNSYKIGEGIAKEAKHYGVNVVLGPGANIKRNPLGGRNFEYFSEDPLLSGKMAGAEIRGLQDNNISACLKHFALNNQENYRFMGNSIVDNRAIREIYLKSFEIALKEGKPDSVMCSYNKINGVYSCQNKWLLDDVLRKEWGFNGVIMTDWGATHDRVEMLKSTLDLEMPGDTDVCRRWIIDAINEKKLDIVDLDNAVKNVLNLIKKHENQVIEKIDFNINNKIAEEVALDSAVLLKNEDILPLNKDEKYLVVGELFDRMRYQGSGSSMINPFNLITPKNAFDNANVNYEYIKGYKENRLEPDNDLLEEIDKKSKDFNTILVFLGLTDYVESEGGDRDNMSLPPNQLAVINKIIKLNKKIVVVLFGGSPIELPFRNDVDAILNMYLPGQVGGEVTRKLLFGEVNPSGKLAETWPISYSDVPFGDKFSKEKIEVYKESIYVGYRYYQKFNKEVAYPFGYGLSYTKFEYSSLNILERDNEIVCSFKIKNIGKYYGGEVAQLYVKSIGSSLFKEVQSLKGFTKVYLKPNEEKEVSITVLKNDLSYFNIKENRFILEEGEYVFNVSSSSIKTELSNHIFIKGENNKSPYNQNINDLYENKLLDVTDNDFVLMSGVKIPVKDKIKPITLESRFTDLKSTFMGKILFNAVLNVAKKDMKKALKLKEGIEKDNKIKGAMFLKRILESNSIITMSMSAGKSMPYHFAKGFVDLSNGHLIKGIKDFTSPIKVDVLPKYTNIKENKNGK